MRGDAERRRRERSVECIRESCINSFERLHTCNLKLEEGFGIQGLANLQLFCSEWLRYKQSKDKNKNCTSIATAVSSLFASK